MIEFMIHDFIDYFSFSNGMSLGGIRPIPTAGMKRRHFSQC